MSISNASIFEVHVSPPCPWNALPPPISGALALWAKSELACRLAGYILLAACVGGMVALLFKIILRVLKCRTPCSVCVFPNPTMSTSMTCLCRQHVCSQKWNQNQIQAQLTYNRAEVKPVVSVRVRVAGSLWILLLCETWGCCKEPRGLCLPCVCLEVLAT